MLRPAAIAILALGATFTAYADVVPVEGISSGTFSNPTTGAVNGGNWTFASGSNVSSISFQGFSFGPGFTPLTFDLGKLTLNNGGNGGLTPGSYTADLAIDVDFATPAGESANFLDTLTLQIVNGSPGKKVAISSMPGPESFPITVGLTTMTYTVTFNGMFDAPWDADTQTGGNDITAEGLTVRNPGSGSAPDNIGYAYLRATVTADGITTTVTDPPPVIPNPEPGSVALLLTAVGGIALSLFRKRLA